MSVVDYTQSLLDPFDTTFPQPKLYDGSVTRSSGLKFRQTGNITLDAAGGDNFVVVLPGFSNGLCWKRPGDATYLTTNAYPTNLDTLTNRANVRRVRLVSSGLKMTLLNSSDDNEGYWEAIRIPFETVALQDQAAPIGEDYKILPLSTFAPTNFANYNTFQTGRLRDLHRFLFKLNSVAPDHPFSEIIDGNGTPPVATSSTNRPWDSAFDIVVIRLVGRIDAVTPSMIQYDFISNMEIVYKDDTVMARLATLNTMVPNLDVLLDRTRFILPAIQVA